MFTEFETANFTWRYAARYGHGCFMRKCDGTSSALISGDDCATVRRDLNRLRSKTGAKRYGGPGFAAIFDSIASEYRFDE